MRESRPAAEVTQAPLATDERGEAIRIVKITKIDTASADVKCGKDEFALPNVTRKTSMCVGAPA